MITVFTCADQFDDMMTCVYDAWASRLGHANVRLLTEPLGTPELFCTYRHVDAQPEKAASVVRTIRQKISSRAVQMVYRTAMAEQEEKLDVIYRFLILGFHLGTSVTDYLQHPSVMRLLELERTVANEAHYFKEFLRFSSLENRVLVGHIEPKSNVLTLLAPHFADRLPSENWMIIDDRRRLAVVHPADRDYYLTPLSPKEFQTLSREPDDTFIHLWKGFFHHIGISQRRNSRCQRTMLPLWYRKNMTEFR